MYVYTTNDDDSKQASRAPQFISGPGFCVCVFVWLCHQPNVYEKGAEINMCNVNVEADCAVFVGKLIGLCCV